jgi:anti-anti-sigma factor
MSDARTVWLYRPDSPSSVERQRCGRAAFEVRQLTAARLCVTVVGEVDATNREALGRFVERHTRISKQLVLDLSKVDFFGSQGFTALYYVGVQCARRDVDWMIVGNRIVQRIVHICDTEDALPVVDDLDAARHRLDHLIKHRRPPARKSAASSTGRPARPSGVSPQEVSTSFARFVNAMSGAPIRPGAAPFTPMPLSPNN